MESRSNEFKRSAIEGEVTTINILIFNYLIYLQIEGLTRSGAAEENERTIRFITSINFGLNQSLSISSKIHIPDY